MPIGTGIGGRIVRDVLLIPFESEARSRVHDGLKDLVKSPRGSRVDRTLQLDDNAVHLESADSQPATQAFMAAALKANGFGNGEALTVDSMNAFLKSEVPDRYEELEIDTLEDIGTHHLAALAFTDFSEHRDLHLEKLWDAADDELGIPSRGKAILDNFIERDPNPVNEKSGGGWRDRLRNARESVTESGRRRFGLGRNHDDDKQPEAETASPDTAVESDIASRVRAMEDIDLSSNNKLQFAVAKSLMALDGAIEDLEIPAIKPGDMDSLVEGINAFLAHHWEDTIADPSEFGTYQLNTLIEKLEENNVFDPEIWDDVLPEANQNAALDMSNTQNLDAAPKVDIMKPA